MYVRQKLSRIFYGWWIVVACFLISLLLGGFVVLGFTAFFEPIANEFGWSYVQISFAASLRGVELGLLAPLLGLVIDRWGPRRLMVAGTILVGLSLIFLSRTNSLTVYYGVFALLAIGISGLSPTVIMTAVANWFRKKVGLATGIMSSGFALGGLLIPVVVKLIDIFDWRITFFLLGLTIWIIGIPLSLLVRHKPEQYGYHVDGEQENVPISYKSLPSVQNQERDIGIVQALRSRIFWHIGVAMTLQFLSISAVTVHVMPYLSTVDIPRSVSGLVATALPLASIIGRVGSGWLSDKFNKKRVAIGFFTMMVFGLLSFMNASIDKAWLLVPFFICFGIGWGGNNIIRPALIREYFGISKFGAILGFTMGMSSVGGILGPLFAGWAFDYWGNYNIAWLVMVCLVFTGLLILATMPTGKYSR